MTNEQKLIEAIQKEKSENSSNTESLANLLDSFTKTVFGEPRLSVYELLQNADDASKNGQDINVDILLEDNFLIFKHNGAIFNDKDVMAICDIKSSKSKDSNKIGYKGIGFKSLFGFSDCVSINSGNYSFKFDKDYWDGRVYNIPWQITPIWINNKDSKYNEKGLTTFVIKISDKYLKRQRRINEDLNEVLNDEKIILFLRHIKLINLNNSKEIVKEERLTENETIQRITISKRNKANTKWLVKKNNQWLLKDFIIKISSDLKTSLKRLSKTECPERLKTADNSKLTFAISIDENENIAAISDKKNEKNRNVYCYFRADTKANPSFPFVINGDFLLDDKRVDFLDNEWNDYLFYNIGYKFIEWLSILAQTNKYKFQVNKVLNKFRATPTKIHKKYNEGVQEAKKKFRFIPSLSDENYLLKSTESIIDITDFSQKLGQEWMGLTQKQVISPKIEATDKLKKIGVEEFNLESIRKLLQNSTFKTNNDLKQVNKNIKLIEYLYKKYRNSNYNFHNYPFILSNKNLIEAPKDIFIPMEIDLPDGLYYDLDLIHSELYKLLLAKKYIINWLRQTNIGLDTIKPFYIIKSFLENKTNEIDKNNYLGISKFILDNYSNFTNDELKILHKIKILTKNGTFISADKCYLADCYEPELKLENFVDINFVSEKYLNHGDKFKWRELFTKIDIKDRPIIYQNTYTYPEILKLPKDYINYLIINKENINTIRIQNFTTIEYYQYLENIDFSKAFWKYFIDNWKTLESKLFQTKISLDGGRRYHEIDAHFKYYITTVKTLPAENEESCYKATDLYSKRLSNILINKPLFFLDIDDDQAEILGINYKLDIEEILDLFPQYETIRNLKAYELLCKYVIDNIVEKINKRNIKLLSQNNEFIKIENLYFFDIEGQITPINNTFIKLPNSFTTEECDTFCTLFGITKITKKELTIEYSNQVDNEHLKKIINDVLDFISIIISKKRNILLDDVKKELQLKVETLSIYTAQNLYTVFNTIYKHKTDAYLINDNDLFVESNWSNIESINTISKLLAKYLNIEIITSELNLFLTLLLNNDRISIQKWLVKNDYEVDSISYLNDSLQGEQFVFELLKKELLESYSNLEVTINNNTELILGKEYVILRWNSEIRKNVEEGSCLYDIYKEINIEKEFIKVKKINHNSEFSLTGNQFKFMNNKENDYSIYIVSSIDKNPTYKIYKNILSNPELSIIESKFVILD